MGNLNRARGDFSAARSWYEKQIETDSRDAAGYLFLGTMQFRLGELDAAQATLQRGLECEFGCLEELHLTLGLVCVALNDLTSALNHLNQSLKIDPAYAPAKTALKDVKNAMAL
jgi:tetratricopeptide (TPR) repeat protein